MKRYADYETQLRDFHTQGYSQRTMARLLNLSTSTVAKRLKQFGLAAPVDPPPRMSTKRMPHVHPGIPEPMLNDLRELVDWWRARRAALQHAQEANRKTERVTFHVEPRWIEAIRRQADLDGDTLTAAVDRAFQAFFCGEGGWTSPAGLRRTPVAEDGLLAIPLSPDVGSHISRQVIRTLTNLPTPRRGP